MISNICCHTNNPYNIRYSKSNDWCGQCGSYKGFVCFGTVDYGVRAAIKLIGRYIHSGNDTPRKIISRYAPPLENKIDDYLTYISFIVPLDTKIVYKSYGFLKLLVAIAYFESGFRLDTVYLSYIINRFNL